MWCSPRTHSWVYSFLYLHGATHSDFGILHHLLPCIADDTKMYIKVSPHDCIPLCNILKTFSGIFLFYFFCLFVCNMSVNVIWANFTKIPYLFWYFQVFDIGSNNLIVLWGSLLIASGCDTSFPVIRQSALSLTARCILSQLVHKIKI